MKYKSTLGNFARYMHLSDFHELPNARRKMGKKNKGTLLSQYHVLPRQIAHYTFVRTVRLKSCQLRNNTHMHRASSGLGKHSAMLVIEAVAGIDGVARLNLNLCVSLRWATSLFRKEKKIAHLMSWTACSSCVSFQRSSGLSIGSSSNGIQ